MEAASYMQTIAPRVQEEDRFPSLVTGVSNLQLSLCEALQPAASAEHQPTLNFSCWWRSPLAPEPALHFLLALHNSSRGLEANIPARLSRHCFGGTAETAGTQRVPSACGGVSKSGELLLLVEQPHSFIEKCLHCFLRIASA